MQEAVGLPKADHDRQTRKAKIIQQSGLFSARVRVLPVFLILVATVNPLPVSGASLTSESFRAGLSFSRTRPLSVRQEAALLKGLRWLTGFAEIKSDDQGFLVLGNRADILGGSRTARALISAVVDGPDLYTVENHQRSPELAFARIRASLDYLNLKSGDGLTRHMWSVDIDFHDYNELRGQAEAIRAFDPALNLLHELAHAALRLKDSTTEEDSLGDCERYINQIRREIGLPERQSYKPVTTQAVTPYGTGQRILGELSFARILPGKGIKAFRLTFDVANVFAAVVAKHGSETSGRHVQTEELN